MPTPMLPAVAQAVQHAADDDACSDQPQQRQRLRVAVGMRSSGCAAALLVHDEQLIAEAGTRPLL